MTAQLKRVLVSDWALHTPHHWAFSYHIPLTGGHGDSLCRRTKGVEVEFEYMLELSAGRGVKLCSHCRFAADRILK